MDRGYVDRFSGGPAFGLPSLKNTGLQDLKSSRHQHNLKKVNVNLVVGTIVFSSLIATHTEEHKSWPTHATKDSMPRYLHSSLRWNRAWICSQKKNISRLKGKEN